jgi:putative phosphoesterase
MIAVFRVGLISDTHGVLRPEASAFLKGSDHIVHAGDIGAPAILDGLAELAPVTAVRGNNDTGAWAAHLHEIELLEIGEVRIQVIHDLAELRADPGRAAIRVVVSGHSHKPSVAERDGVLFVNPGSAGPRRFTLPVSVGEILVENGSVVARTVELAVPAKGGATRLSGRSSPAGSG